MLPLAGLLVVSLEQAVAAPYCTCRLADAGARVLKIERPEGDFARVYDSLAKGESVNFVWLNRGKESVVLDLRVPDDRALLERLISRADVFIDNLKPGAAAKLGFATTRLRETYPRLVTCSITGYGETGPFAHRKAYDLLVQAESGLAHLTGSPEAPARVGVSVVDVAAGLAAYEAILEALIARGRTGEGMALAISMFDAIAEWMAVPLMQHEGGRTPTRVGLKHPTIAPYGVFVCRGGEEILLAIQNDREWVVLARDVLGDAALATDPRFATNIARVAAREETDARVQSAFATMDVDDVITKLDAADIAFGRVNDVAGLARHPHLRRIVVATPSGEVSCPGSALSRTRTYGAVPALGAHTESVRREFTAGGRE